MNKRLLILDIMRGLAAVAVFLSHLRNEIELDSIFHSVINCFMVFQRYFLWCNGGLHWAVIVFIVLSGFCIHMANIKSENGELSKIKFLRKRFYRIYPVLLFSVFIGYGVYLLNNSFTYSSLFKNAVGNLLLLSGLSPSFQPPLGNEILITVIVECLLYLIYPFCVPHTKGQWLLLFAIVIGVYFANFSLILFTSIDATWLGRNIFSFLVYWWIGAFSAEIIFNNSKNKKWKLEKVQLVIVTLFLYCIYVLIGNFINFKGAHIFKSLYLASLTGFALICFVSLELKTEQSKSDFFFKSIFTRLGEISYSLYVIHVPIIGLLSYFVGSSAYKNSSQFYFINIGSVFFGTLLCYYIIEKPSHDFAKKLSRDNF